MARTYAESLQPDHIILGFFVANDVIPNAIAFVDKKGKYSGSANQARVIRNMLKEKLGVLYHSNALRIIAQRVYVPRLGYQVANTDVVISSSHALPSELINTPGCAMQGSRWSFCIEETVCWAEYCRHGQAVTRSTVFCLTCVNDETGFFV